MRRFLFYSIGFLIAPTTPSWSDQPVSHHIGVAKIDVTPDYPVRLSGFGFRREESDGTQQRIWAKALAIGGDTKDAVVLITVDNLGIPHSMVREVGTRLQTKSGFVPERLSIAATHTHTAPMLRPVAPTLFGQPIPQDHMERIDRYTREMADALETVALNALRARKPGTLRWGIGSVGFAINRRTAGGPVDHDLPLLAAYDAVGKLIAVHVSYACHCVTLSHNKVGGDWAGYAQSLIEERNEGTVALVAIGCGADANPVSGVVGDRVEVAHAQGQHIADETSRLLQSRLTLLDAEPTVRHETIELPLEELPRRDHWLELGEREDAIGYHARVQLARLDRGEKLQTKIEYPIRTWAFGDRLAMVFLPGEVVVDYALRLKRELDGRRLWINAYSNGAPCYIPSERVLKEGGYEGGGAMVYYDVPTRFRSGLEEKIVDTIRDQLGDSFNSKIDPKRTGDTLPKTPQQSRACLRTHENLTVELVAAEPLVVDPVAIDFGPDGRVWVAEMRDYPLGLDGNYAAGGKVRFLEDVDSDGIYDRAVTFLDQLPFPTGVMPWRDGVLVCAAPEILFARDTNGDGAADAVRTLYSGFATHNYQARVNSLRYGLDHWVWGASGLFGGEIESFTGQTIDLRGRDFRIQPDSGRIDAVSGITQHGRTRDDWGEWFGCNSGTLLQHYPMVARYARRNPHVSPPAASVYVPDYADSRRLYPSAESLVLFKLSGPPARPTAACGAEIYRDEFLGDSFHGNAFTCEPVNQLVHRLVLRPKGCTYSARRAPEEERVEFLSSTDPWFRPVEARTGPDGTLWIVDMYRYVIEHPRWIPPETVEHLDVRAGAGMGRIWRVRPRERPPRSWPRLDRLSTAGLVAALDSPNGPQRDLAQQLLIEGRDRSAIPPLEKLVRNGTWGPARIQALHALAGLDALQPKTVATLMRDPHPRIALHAVRLGETIEWTQEISAAFDDLLDVDDDRLQLQLAYSLGEHPANVSAARLPRLLMSADAYVRAAALSSLHPENAGYVIPDTLAKLSASSELNLQLRTELARQLGRLVATMGDEILIQKTVQILVGSASPGIPEPAHHAGLVSILDVLARGGVAKIPVDLRHEISALMVRSREALRSGTSSSDSRIAAIALLGREAEHVAADIQLLATQLSPALPADVRTAAVSALARLQDEQAADALLQSWQSHVPAIREQVLEALIAREKGALKLLDAINAGEVRKGSIDATRARRLREHPSAGVRELAIEVLKPAAPPEEIVERYARALTLPGDSGRGKVVFLERCASCHRLGTDGHAVGPDLAALTAPTPQSLLVAILNPDQEVEDRYLSYSVVTNDGRVVSGLIQEETENSLRLISTDGEEHVVLRSDVVRLESGGSFMPRGLEDGLTSPDLADLLAFLRRQGPTPKRFDGNRPRVVVPESDGALVLSAARGEIYGDDICFEVPHQNIGHWHTERDVVVWTAKIERAAKYDVIIEWSCHPDSAGNRWKLEGGSKPLLGTVTSTGGWDRFREAAVGSLELSAGYQRFSMRAEGPLAGRALFDLKTVRLIPRP